MDIYSVLESFSSKSRKEYTDDFNSLSMEDRRVFLGILSDTEAKDFVDKIHNQAIDDFWTHERDLIEQGQCTRDWTPDQIESIMHISEKTGNKKLEGGVPKAIKPNH